MGKICEVCGKPSGMYPICRECFKLKDEGKVIKCEKCGKWHYANKPCECEKQNNQDNYDKKNNLNKEKINKDKKCIVCNNPSGSYPQCQECFSEAIEFMDELDKNKKPFELRDYYYNLKSNIYRMQDFNTVKHNCNKLIAISMLIYKLYDDTSLANRIENDVQDIIIAKTPKIQEQNFSEYVHKQDAQKEGIIRTMDGHIVKSDAEKTIDDILYNLRILHCYSKQVTEIPIEIRTVESDWFLPVISMQQGIYIEYWGIDSKQSYLNNKSEKKEIYKKYNIPLIEIEKDEINGDSQGLSNRIYMEFQSLKKKYYNI